MGPSKIRDGRQGSQRISGTKDGQRDPSARASARHGARHGFQQREFRRQIAFTWSARSEFDANALRAHVSRAFGTALPPCFSPAVSSWTVEDVWRLRASHPLGSMVSSLCWRPPTSRRITKATKASARAEEATARERDTTSRRSRKDTKTSRKARRSPSTRTRGVGCHASSSGGVDHPVVLDRQRRTRALEGARSRR